MLMLQPPGGKNVDLNTPDPLDLANTNPRIEKIRTRMNVSVPRVEDTYFITMRCLKRMFIEILELPDIM